MTSPERRGAPGTPDIKHSVEFGISLNIAQWLQQINQEKPRRADVADLLTGAFICAPEKLGLLSGYSPRFFRYLETDCHLFLPQWLYQYHFSRRMRLFDESDQHVMLYTDTATDVLARSKAIALEEAGDQSNPALLTVGHLLQAMLTEPNPVGEKLRELGFSLEKIRRVYDV
ncbi:MAG TPA: hypothetical protein VGM27_20695 [Acidobacteriaceae bacterium]